MANTKNNIMGQVSKEHLGYPFIFLSLYFFLDYVRPQDMFPPLEHLHLGALVSVILGFAWVSKGRKDFSNPQTALLIAFLVIMAKSIPLAFNNYYAFHTTQAMIMIFVFYYLCMVAFLDSTKKIRAFLHVFVLVHAFLALMAIKSGGQGVGNFLKDENDFALAINMAIPYCLFLSQDKGEPPIYRRTFLILLPLFLVANVLTHSRGGLLGMLAIFACFSLMQEKKGKTIVAFAGIVLLMLLLSPDSYLAKMKTIDRSNVSGWDTGNARLYLWGLGWKMFLDHPFLGIGPGNYPWTLPFYEIIDPSNSMLSLSRGGKVVHSLYFTLLPELAIPGVLIFVAMVWRNFGYLRWTSKLMRRPNNGIQLCHMLEPSSKELLEQTHMVNKIMICSLVGYLVSGAFISVLYYPHFWILSAIMVASMNNFRRDFQEKHSA
jgi:O-antigen ligase